MTATHFECIHWDFTCVDWRELIEHRASSHAVSQAQERAERGGDKSMTEYREVTLEERQAMRENGVFDINGNIPAHPGYTGIHRRIDGTYWHRGTQITDPTVLYAIEHRNDPVAEAASMTPILKSEQRRWWQRILRFRWKAEASK